MKKLIDIDTWDRKEHFNFFKDFDEPFFGICTEMDCTVTCQRAKEQGISLFIIYLYKSLRAANEIEEFRYRIEGDRVVCFDTVNASPTVKRDNGTFGFGYIDYREDFDEFLSIASVEIERVSRDRGLVPATSSENVIHYTTLPWIRFTAVTLARHYAFRESIPKITFGRIFPQGSSMMLPLSVQVHHALMDGYHLGLYLERFQSLLSE